MKNHAGVATRMTVRLDEIYIRRTYGEWLMGIPQHEEAIKAATSRMVKMWGSGRPIVTLDPTLTERKTRQGTVKVLPEWEFHCWLVSNEIVPNGESFDAGSHLIAIWWDDRPTYDLDKVLAQIDWAKTAQNFDP